MTSTATTTSRRRTTPPDRDELLALCRAIRCHEHDRNRPLSWKIAEAIWAEFGVASKLGRAMDNPQIHYRLSPWIESCPPLWQSHRAGDHVPLEQIEDPQPGDEPTAAALALDAFTHRADTPRMRRKTRMPEGMYEAIQAYVAERIGLLERMEHATKTWKRASDHWTSKRLLRRWKRLQEALGAFATERLPPKLH